MNRRGFFKAIGALALTPLAAKLAAVARLDVVTIWDASLGNVITVTLTRARTILRTANLRPGTYILRIQQDMTGERTITWGSEFKWPAGLAPTLSTRGNAQDIVPFVSDGKAMYGANMLRDIS